MCPRQRPFYERLHGSPPDVPFDNELIDIPKECDMRDEREIRGEVMTLHLSRSEDGKRVESPEIFVDSRGVKGDKFYGKDPMRSILVTTVESYEMARAAGIDISYGMLGENILIDFNPYRLPPGTRFAIGDVVLEIAQNCTLCKSLSKVDPKLPKLLKHDRGLFARVLKGGVIHTGDALRPAGEQTANRGGDYDK